MLPTVPPYPLPPGFQVQWTVELVEIYCLRIGAHFQQICRKLVGNDALLRLILGLIQIHFLKFIENEVKATVMLHVKWWDKFQETGSLVCIVIARLV